MPILICPFPNIEKIGEVVPWSPMKKSGFEVDVASIERSPKGVEDEIPTFPVVLSKVKLAEDPNDPPSLN